MVSKQEGTLYSRKRDFSIFGDEFHNYSFKKLKHEDQSQEAQTRRLISFDFELHHLHTKGYSKASDEDHKTCLKDPMIVERPKMSLDLELNLSPSYSPSKSELKKDQASDHHETVSLQGKTMMNPRLKTSLRPSPSWLAFEGVDDEDKEQEMVTTVCMKCHMLIMLSTSTPVCPNCKFMHPHDHNSTKQFKPSNLLKLLC